MEVKDYPWKLDFVPSKLDSVPSKLDLLRNSMDVESSRSLVHSDIIPCMWRFGLNNKVQK